MTLLDRSNEQLPTHRPISATAEALRQLAPWVTVAALAYPALVWPLLEAEVVALGPLVGQPAVDGPPSMLVRTYFPVLLVLGALAFGSQVRQRVTGWSRPAILMICVYLAWAGATSLWAVEPEIAFRRFLLATFIAGAIAMSALAARNGEGIVHRLFWVFVLVTLINVASVATTPATALGHAGIYPHKNYLGVIVSIIMLVAFYELSSGTTVGRIAAALVLVACTWMLIEARSKTCLALMLVVPPLGYGTAMLARVARISPVITLGVAGLALWLVYAIGAASHIWDFEDVATAVFGDPTLTQRTDIWAFAIKMIEQRPWTGYGYEVFWGAGINSPSVREGPGFIAQMPHAHNGYIDIVLQTGYIGLAIFAVLLAAALHVAGRVAARSYTYAALLISLILFCILHNSFETTWFRSFGLLSMVFVLATVLASSDRDAQT